MVSPLGQFIDLFTPLGYSPHKIWAIGVPKAGQVVQSPWVLCTVMGLENIHRNKYHNLKNRLNPSTQYITVGEMRSSGLLLHRE